MPIDKVDIGKHKDVVRLTFGIGDILFCNARKVGDEHDSEILFSQSTPHPIGTFFHDHVGKPTDELPNVQVMMEFQNLESLKSLIGSLLNLKDSFLNTAVK